MNTPSLSAMSEGRVLKTWAALGVSLGLVFGLAACAHKPVADAAPSKSQKHDPRYAPEVEPEGTPLSHLFSFGANKASKAAVADAGIGVNAYLWRASLDTVSFMPLNSADPWGGTIISDWYTNPEKPDERFKTTVYILDTRLRADALSVAVNKQIKSGDHWVDAEVSAQTAIDIENAILTRARQLRLSDVKTK